MDEKSFCGHTGSDVTDSNRFFSFKLGSKSPCMFPYFIVVFWIPTWTLFALLILFFLVYGSIHYIVPNTSGVPFNNKRLTNANSKTVLLPVEDRYPKVMIISHGRSGSSFLGELFNQDKNAFYIYEPLHTSHVFKDTGYISQQKYQNTCIRFLEDIFNCNFQKWQDYLTFISYPELSPPHYRLASRPLSSPPLCITPMQHGVSEVEFKLKCPPLRYTNVENVCHRHQYRVVKDLIHRLPRESIKSFLPLLDRNSDLHVIYLVRDPRAVISSMKTVGWIGNHTEARFPDSVSAARFLCKQLYSDLSTIFSLQLDILQKIIFIRYEDLALKPLLYMKDIFLRLGLEFPHSVRSWILSNTLTDTTTVSPTTNKDSYTVRNKNSFFTLNSWRQRETFKEIKQIQELCSPVLTLLGYNPFDSESTQHNLSLQYFSSNPPASLRKRVNIPTSYSN